MTVMSYCGTVYFGLNGCRETVPDIGALPAMVADSLDELLAVVRPDGADRVPVLGRRGQQVEVAAPHEPAAHGGWP